MTMQIADILKTLITIIISAISTALTESVKNTTFYLRENLYPRRTSFAMRPDLQNSKSNNIFTVPQREGTKGLCCEPRESTPTACAWGVAQACAADPKSLFQNFQTCKSWLYSRSPRPFPAWSQSPVREQTWSAQPYSGQVPAAT